MKKITKNDVDYSAMRVLGLSTLAIACYAAMDGRKGMHVIELAQRLNRHSSNLYPALIKLEERGLARRFKIQGWETTIFRSIPMEVAFDNYLDRQRRLLLPLMQAQRRREPLA